MTDRKEYLKKKMAEAYWANPEHFRAKSREYYLAHKDEHRKRVKRNYKPVGMKVQVTDPAGFIHDFKSLRKACEFFGLTYLGYKKYPIKFKGFTFILK